MNTLLPLVLIPGLLCTSLFYAASLVPLGREGPVTIANHTRDDSMAAIARRILADAPPRFALAGHSMGGYVAFEIMRQAPERVAKLALLSTAARADLPEQSEARRAQIALALGGRFGEVPDLQFPRLVHAARQGDPELRAAIRQMAEDVGAEAFVRQQNAIMQRPDSRPTLATIRCPTLVLVGDADALTPPERAQEIAAGVVGARLLTLAGCGHMCAMEAPEATTRALVAWLAG
jgi:pimeloyl-ACP methyl ester carboxylesterase